MPSRPADDDVAHARKPRRSASSAADVEDALDAVVAEMGGARREGQHEMAVRVAGALERSEHLLVQAGTGTGKSLGYLVPTLMRAVTSGERAVVSTATLALQRQVIGHDLPLVAGVLRKRLPREPQVALLKGWHNYACVHKIAGGYPAEDDAALFDLGTDAPSSAEEHPGQARADSLAAAVLRVREWAGSTATGDRDELVPGVTDKAWRQVSVTSLECLGQTCPMRAECFPEAARERARTADVVVTNHAMLGIAAAGGSNVLPEHEVLVVDEAHELPARVTAQSSVELSAAVVDRVSRLARRGAGVSTEPLDAAATLLRTELLGAPQGRWQSEVPVPVQGAVRAVADGARQLLSAIGTPSGGNPEAAAGITQARSAATALFEVTERLLSDRLQKRQDVVWCAAGAPGEPVKIHVAPLDVALPIADRLLADRAAVLTSATLTLGGRFETVAAGLGITGRHEAIEVTSPFDYASQGILYVASKLPKPGRDGTDPAVLDEIAALIEAAGGRTLGLFSSRRGAAAAAEAMRQRLDVPVLLQGEDAVPSLVQQFAADPSSCLFGTLSLWQGVDVPGEACQLVLIDRIPFPRPDDPVMQARSEAAERAGGNGFMAVSATHAALLLAQGAGRLIRSTADKGVVAILDPRAATARYGSFLTRSLPPFWPTTNRDVVLSALRRLNGG